jgi:single-strand selective monofunctional uracil DNA glycosylase
VKWLRPRLVIGVGAFAAARAEKSLDGMDVRIGRILHPSPASPAANNGWAEKAKKQLEELGVKMS